MGGAGNESVTSVVVHSAVPLGIELTDEQDPFPTAAERMLVDLETKMPEIPWAKASASKMQKWKYSQVYKGLRGSRPDPGWTWNSMEDPVANENVPGFLTLFQTDHALGMMCGDAFAPASKFDGCVFSAYKAAESLRAFLQARHAE